MKPELARVEALKVPRNLEPVVFKTKGTKKSVEEALRKYWTYPKWVGADSFAESEEIKEALQRVITSLADAVKKSSTAEVGEYKPVLFVSEEGTEVRFVVQDTTVIAFPPIDYLTGASEGAAGLDAETRKAALILANGGEEGILDLLAQVDGSAGSAGSAEDLEGAPEVEPEPEAEPEAEVEEVSDDEGEIVVVDDDDDDLLDEDDLLADEDESEAETGPEEEVEAEVEEEAEPVVETESPESGRNDQVIRAAKEIEGVAYIALARSFRDQAESAILWMNTTVQSEVLEGVGVNPAEVLREAGAESGTFTKEGLSGVSRTFTVEVPSLWEGVESQTVNQTVHYYSSVTRLWVESQFGLAEAYTGLTAEESEKNEGFELV